MASYLSKKFSIKRNIAHFVSYKNRQKSLFSSIFTRLLSDKNKIRPKYIPESTNEKENPDSNLKNEEECVMPEEPTIPCCMTGCPNCVWMDYAEALERYFKDGGAKAVKEINEKIKDPNIKAYLLTELRIHKMQS